MKTCSTCQQQFPLTSFNKRGSGYQGNCRDCNKAYYKNYYQNNPKEKARILAKNKDNRLKIQKFIDEQKSVLCADCGIQYAPHIMQFDHLGEQEKLFTVSTGKNTQTLSRIKEEIAKCEVVCANCHAHRTYMRCHTGVGSAGMGR